MIIIYKYGFTYKGFLFGWKEKKLYRLPSEKNLRNYSLKELSKIKINNHDGYRVVRDKKTIKQLMEMTELINYRYVVNGKQSNDTPF